MSIEIDNGRLLLEGIEIIFTAEDDHRGSVWIPFSESFSLLYGKNGSGKSTILRAIKSFLNGESLKAEGLIISGFARMPSTIESCALIDQAIQDMTNSHLVRRHNFTHSQVIAEFSKLAADLKLPDAQWEQSFFSTFPESHTDLSKTWDKFFSHFVFFGLHGHYESDEAPELASFLNALSSAKTFALQPSGTAEKAEWNLYLSADLSNPQVRQVYEENSSEQDEFDLSGVPLLLKRYGSDRLITRTNSPFAPIDCMEGRKVTSIGISFVDLNQDVDLRTWTKAKEKYFSTLGSGDFKQERSAKELGNGITRLSTDFESEKLDSWNGHLSVIREMLPSFSSVSDLRLAIVPPGSKSDGENFLYLEALDSHAKEPEFHVWLPAEELSQATQKLIWIAINLFEENWLNSDTKVYIGDEIDTGLHSLAIKDLYDLITRFSSISFISSHSASALQRHPGQLIHVQRGDQGELQIQQTAPGEYKQFTAEIFGVRPNELAGMIEICVVVEGNHGKLVVEHLLQIDEKLAQHNIKVVAAHGVSNMKSTANFEYLLNSTDMPVLFLADNVSQSDLTTDYDAFNEALNKGQDPKDTAKKARFRQEQLKDSWHEQFCMRELLIQAQAIGQLHRIKTGGHTYPDIIFALPHESFGLNVTWEELHDEWLKWKKQIAEKQKNDFKSFLRMKHRVNISEEMVSKALASINEIPTPLQPMFDLIRSNIYII
jgi:ABC-type multidrug transport system ATPase subunit